MSLFRGLCFVGTTGYSCNLVTFLSLSLSPLSGLFFRATQNPRLDNDVAELHVPAVFVPVLDDAGEDDAANLPVGQVLLVLLSAHVLHGVRLEQHLLVRQDAGHVHPQSGLLHYEQAREFDGVFDEHAEGRVSGRS